MAMTWEELAVEVYVSIWTGKIIDDTVTRVQGGDFDRLLAQAKDQAKKAVAARDAVLNVTKHFARTARVVVGTSAAGWTTHDCDYLCDGVDDQEEINAAIEALALSSAGGKVVILDGEYNLTQPINMNVFGITLSGNGHNTRLNAKGFSSAAIVISGDRCAVQDIYLYVESTAEYDIDAINVGEGKYNVIRGCGINAYYASSGIILEEENFGTIIIGNEIFGSDILYLNGTNAVVVGNIMRSQSSYGQGPMCYIFGNKNLVVGNNAAESKGPIVRGEKNVVVGNITSTDAEVTGRGNLVIETQLTDIWNRTDDLQSQIDHESERREAQSEWIAELEARIAALEGGNANPTPTEAP